MIAASPNTKPKKFSIFYLGISELTFLKTGCALFSVVLLYMLFAFYLVQPAQASNVPFQTGDVLVGVSPGTIRHFSPQGVLLDTSFTGGRSFMTGMAFDAAGNLYATAFEAQAVFRFDNKGNLLGTFGSGYNQEPESIVFDNTGNVFVGQADGTHRILEFNPGGAPIGSFKAQTDERGTDWIDLAADQCTIFYTSEGDNVKRFNVCANAQLPDFATGLSGPCFAHRIRPNFETLVACTTLIYRLDSSGNVMQSYPLADAKELFALNLDPDNKTFWTGDLQTGTIYHVDIASGKTLLTFNAGGGTVAGVTVVGEITAAVTPPPASTSYYVTTTNSKKLHDAGRDLALAQIATRINQDSVAALLFRAPTFSNGQYGTAALGITNIPLSTVEILVKDFASGYYNALGNNNTLHVRIVIATSNGTTQCQGSQVSFGHGQAWAQMVNDVASWVISQGYSGQVDIAGGSDMEPEMDVWPPAAGCNSGGQPKWASRSDTVNWVNGYSSISPRRFLYDVGAASGCPQSGTTLVPGTCNNGYTQEDIWFISWGAPPSEPLPEIYTTSGSMANEWQQLSLYGRLAHNDSMTIAGALTELGACQQRGCSALLRNSPAQGWQQLFNALRSDPRTNQTLSWSTDIKYLN